ncbi:MAG: TolC family protein [Pseudomonadota bacterium]
MLLPRSLSPVIFWVFAGASFAVHASDTQETPLAEAPIPPELEEALESDQEAGDEDGPGLAELVRQAVDNHPSIQESLARIMQQRENVKMEKAGFLPQVTASTRSEYNSSLDRYVDVAGVTASQLIWDFGAVSSSVQRERSGLERTRAEALERIEELSGDVGLTVVDLQRQQALRRVAVEQLERIEDLRDVTGERARRGASAQSELRQAEARVEAARITLSRVDSGLHRSQRELARFIPGIEVDGVADELPGGVAHACRDVRIDSGADLPSVLAAEASRDESRAQLAADRASRWPRLSVDVRADRYLDSDIDDQNHASVYLNASVDLFRGGANRARVSGSRYREQAAQHALDTAMLDAREDLASARLQSRDLERQLRSLTLRIDHLDEVRELYRTQYLKAGTRTLLDVLNAEQEYFQARFDLIDARYDHRHLQVQCLIAGGQMRSAFDISTEMVGAAGDFE